MVNSNKSIFEYKISPFIQAGVILAGILILLIGSKLLGMTGWVETDEGTPWLIACSMTFFYAIGNSILGLATDDQNKYWWQSILNYVGLVVLGGSMAYLFSGVSMDDVGSYKWLYVVFAFGHILFLAIVRALRGIVIIAKKQDSRLRGEDDK